MNISIDNEKRLKIGFEPDEADVRHIRLDTGETKLLVEFLREHFPTYNGWWGLFYGGLVGLVIMAALVGLKNG